MLLTKMFRGLLTLGNMAKTIYLTKMFLSLPSLWNTTKKLTGNIGLHTLGNNVSAIVSPSLLKVSYLQILTSIFEPIPIVQTDCVY